MNTINRQVAIIACPKEINPRANSCVGKDTYLVRLSDWGKFRQYLEKSQNQLEIISKAESFFVPVSIETLSPDGFVLRVRIVATIPVEMENDNFVLTFFPGDRNFYGLPGDVRNYSETQTCAFITRTPYGETPIFCGGEEDTPEAEAVPAVVESTVTSRVSVNVAEVDEEPKYGKVEKPTTLGEMAKQGGPSNQNKFEYVDIVHLIELEFVGGVQELLVCYADQSWEAVTIEWPNPFGPWQVVAKAVLGNEHLPAASKLSTLLTTANAALSTVV